MKKPARLGTPLCRVADDQVEFTTACAGIGFPRMIKLLMSSSGKSQSKIKTALPLK